MVLWPLRFSRSRMSLTTAAEYTPSKAAVTRSISSPTSASILSFREFLDFHGYTVTEKKSPTGALKRRITDQDGDIYDERELFNEYARFGGMPMLADVGLEIEREESK